MGQSVKIIGGEKQTTRYYGGPPTFIPTGDTADEIPLNPAIAGFSRVQELLEDLNDRTCGIPVQVPPFAQLTPSTEWIWNHNLGYRPVPEIYSLAYQEIEAEVEQVSVNQLRVRVNPAMPGYIVI